MQLPAEPFPTAVPISTAAAMTHGIHARFRRRLRHTLRVVSGRCSVQRFNGKRQITGRLESPRDILFQASRKDPFSSSGPASRYRSAPVALRARLRSSFLRSLAFESPFAGKHLVEHCTETENVRSGVDRFAPHLLRRHVATVPITRPGKSPGSLASPRFRGFPPA